MAKQANPWAAMDEGIANAAGVQQRIQTQEASNLLAAAKGLRITSGFSRGGHNSGSMHYQGSEDDPGAIDVDPRGMTPERVAQLKSQGFVVVDERSRPKGQSVWTGPHYHIQKQRNGQKHQQAQNKDMLKPAAPVAAAPDKPVDLHLPLTQDIHGNTLTRNQAPGVTDAEIEQYVQGNMPAPVQLDVPPSTPIDKDNPWAAMDDAIAQAQAPAPNVSLPALPKKDPTFIEGLGNLWNAGGQMLQQIPGAFQREYQSQQADPFFNQQDMMGAALTGMTSAPTDLLNLTTQAPAAVGNAFLGRQEWEPLIPEVYGARDIPGLKEMTERHPVADFMGGAAVPIDLGLGALSRAKGTVKGAGAVDMLAKNSVFADSVVAEKAYQQAVKDRLKFDKGLEKKYKSLAGFDARYAELDAKIKNRTATAKDFKEYQEIIKQVDKQTILRDASDRVSTQALEINKPQSREQVVRDMLKPEPALTPDEAARLDVTPKADMLNKPEAVQELSQGFQQRVYDANGQPQVIDPRKAPIPEELGPLKTETTESGLIIATKAGKRETPQIGIVRGLPEGRKVEPSVIEPPKPGPAQESASVLSSQMDDVDAAKQLRDEAFETLRAKEQELTRSAKAADVVEAQRSFGSRINELEAKASRTRLTDGERQELAYRRGLYDSVLESRKALNDAESLYNETSSVTPRQSLDAPAPVEPLRLPENTAPKSSVDIGLQRADEIPDALAKGKPAKVDMLAKKSNVSPIRQNTNAPVDLLDAQGRSMSGKQSAQIDLLKPRPVDPANLETPKPFVRPEAPAPKPLETSTPATSVDAPANVYKAPQGGEVYTHGRDIAEIQKQLEGFKGQIANITDIERHLQTHNPDAAPAIRNILNAGKNSEAVQFSYVAREAPGEPARVRANFIPTHFTYETIKPATQRSFLRRKYGSDEAVISHLKQEIINRGGSVDAASLQTKGGADIAPATQISRLINALDTQTGGAYLKSPRVHGINMGETTRSAVGDRGIRLDTITDSSLTGRKVTPDEMKVSSYQNQIAPALKALTDLANTEGSTVFKRAVKQIQKGEITGKTMRELKAALKDDKLAAQFCNVFGIKL